MIDWPIEILGVQKQGRSVSFCPFAAKSRGYAVYPLVEVDIEETIDALSKEFGIPVNYLYLAKIDFKFSHRNEYHSFGKDEKFSAIHKSIFLREIESGVYLEAFYVNKSAILVVLGGDESWVVLDRSHYPQRSPEFDRLITGSMRNIQILKKGEKFQEFLKV